MTAIAPIEPRRKPPAHRAFTLTELLVVIALVVLLVSLLLAALGQVQTRSRLTSTLATMQAFSNACETFHQDHGFYPGVVPEARLTTDPQLTGTENAILSLMGGSVTEEAVGTTSFNSDYPLPDWKPLVVDGFRLKINRGKIGEGPRIRNRPYAPYLTPGDREFGFAEGQVGDPGPQSNRARVPDLLDAWGQPIIYVRRQRSIGVLASAAPGDNPQFSLSTTTPYSLSENLGRLGQDQVFVDGSNPAGGILSVDAENANLNLEKMLSHPALPGQARGAYMLLSAGPDGVYLSAEDGPGTAGAPVWDVGARINLAPGEQDYLPPDIFEEYDDVMLFGGS